MPPQIDPVGIELELLFQETQVPLSLVGLIPIIAEMVNGEPRGPDAASAGGDDPVQIRHDRLVNSTLETNARVAPEQAMLRISREPGSRMEADGACTQVWVSELGFQDQAVIYANPFICVDVENPVACGLVDGMVSRRSEIVMPLVIHYASAASDRNLAGPIA